MIGLVISMRMRCLCLKRWLMCKPDYKFGYVSRLYHLGFVKRVAVLRADNAIGQVEGPSVRIYVCQFSSKIRVSTGRRSK